MRKIKLLFVCFMLLQFAAEAQFYQHSFGNEGRTEIGYSIIREESYPDEVVIAGLVKEGPMGRADATLTKTDVGGSLIWSRMYGDSRDNLFNCVRGDIPYSDIGYVAVGVTETMSSFIDHDVYLVGTDHDGNLLFTSTYGGSRYDEGKCVQVVKLPPSPTHIEEFGYIIAGVTNSYSNNRDAYIILTSIKGELLKSFVMTGYANMGANWIEQISDNDFVITGYCYDCMGNKMVYAARFDQYLNIMWSNKYYIPPYKEAEGFCIKEDPTGRLVITGYTNNGHDDDVFLLKLGKDGAVLDLMTYNYGTFDRGHNLMIEKNELGEINYLVSGRVDREIGVFNEIDGLFFKTNKDLIPVWTRRYGLERVEETYEICKGVEKGYMLTGRVNSFGFGEDDIYLISADDNGKTHTICDKEVPFEIRELCSDPAVYGKQDLVEWYQPYDTHAEFIEYHNDKCIAQDSDKLNIEDSENSVNQLKVYPSPASNMITVEYADEFVGGKLKIYNALGKLMISENIEDSNHQNIELDALSNGVYMLKVEKDGKSKTIMFQKQ